MGGSSAGGSSTSSVTINEEGAMFLRNSSTRMAEYGVSLRTENTRRDTDRNLDERINRDVQRDDVSNQQLLDPACRAMLKDTLTRMHDDLNSSEPVDTALMKQFAKQQWTRATSLSAQVKDKIDKRVMNAYNKIMKNLCERYDDLAKTAGSSRNCFVQDAYQDAVRDAMVEFADLSAKFELQGIDMESKAINDAYRNSYSAFVEASDRDYGNMGTLWGILRGSNVDATASSKTDDDTVRDLNEDINENVFSIIGTASFNRKVLDTAEGSGTYQGDYDAALAAGAGISI